MKLLLRNRKFIENDPVPEACVLVDLTLRATDHEVRSALARLAPSAYRQGLVAAFAGVDL